MSISTRNTTKNPTNNSSQNHFRNNFGQPRNFISEELHNINDPESEVEITEYNDIDIDQNNSHNECLELDNAHFLVAEASEETI